MCIRDSLAAILLECSVSGSVSLQDLDEYNTPARRIRITATPGEHDAMNKALADFAHNPLEYDLSEMMDEGEIQEMARDVESLRKELYDAAGRNRDYHVKAEDVKHLLPDWEGADGCIATNRITVEGYKAVSYTHLPACRRRRQKWQSGSGKASREWICGSPSPGNRSGWRKTWAIPSGAGTVRSIFLSVPRERQPINTARPAPC